MRFRFPLSFCTCARWVRWWPPAAARHPRPSPIRCPLPFCVRMHTHTHTHYGCRITNDRSPPTLKSNAERIPSHARSYVRRDLCSFSKLNPTGGALRGGLLRPRHLHARPLEAAGRCSPFQPSLRTDAPRGGWFQVRGPGQGDGGGGWGGGVRVYFLLVACLG